MLPTFIIIGAPRCGTTSLYAYLKQHPEIYMSPLKETNYFLFGGSQPNFGGPDGRNIARDSVYRLADYHKLFAGRTDERAAGEASPRYLDCEGTASRIHQLLPDVKLVAILREPVRRALSHYTMRKRDGWEPCGTFEAAMADEARRVSENWAGGIYVQRGFYARHLDAYYRIFPSEQIRVYLFEDLQERPDELFADLFAFLGVDPGFRPDISQSFNTSGVIRNPLMRWVWTRTHPMQAVVRPLLPKRTRQTISNLFTGLEKGTIDFSPELRRQLRDTYRTDVIALQGRLGRDLSAWLDA